jgi:hypothetical protein
MLSPEILSDKTKVNVLVRKATHDDVSDLVEMGEKFHAKSSFSEFGEFVADDFSQTVESIMSGKMPGALFVADDGSQLVGMAGAIYFPLYFNFSSTLGQEVFLWAEKETGLGMRLLDALERHAADNGVVGFMTGSISGLRDEAVGRSYRMRGYRPGENSFMKRLSS